MQAIRIVLDTTEAEAQVTEMMELFREVFVDHVPNHIVDNVSRLASDISIADGGTTLSADGITENRLIIRLGSRFHDVMSALRTGKTADLSHDIDPAFRDSKL